MRADHADSGAEYRHHCALYFLGVPTVRLCDAFRAVDQRHQRTGARQVPPSHRTLAWHRCDAPAGPRSRVLPGVRRPYVHDGRCWADRCVSVVSRTFLGLWQGRGTYVRAADHSGRIPHCRYGCGHIDRCRARLLGRRADFRTNRGKEHSRGPCGGRCLPAVCDWSGARMGPWRLVHRHCP